MPCVRRHQPGHTRSSALDVQAAQGGPAQASSRAGRSRVHPARCSAAGRGGCTRHPHRLRPRPPPTQPDHRLTTPHRTPPRPPPHPAPPEPCHPHRTHHDRHAPGPTRPRNAQPNRAAAPAGPGPVPPTHTEPQCAHVPTVGRETPGTGYGPPTCMPNFSRREKFFHRQMRSVHDSSRLVHPLLSPRPGEETTPRRSIVHTRTIKSCHDRPQST